MKFAIMSLFMVCVTSVTAITNNSYDLRFPIDAKVIQGALNKDNIVHIYYEVNEKKTVIDYFLRDTEHTCGSNKIEMNDSDHFKNFKILILNQDNIMIIPLAPYPVNFELVNFSTCKRTEIILSTKLTEFEVTIYADSFDIYFKDSSACKDKYCRKSYDFNGKLISTPFIEFHSDTSIPVVKPIGSQVRSDKYLAFEITKEKKIANLVDSGKSKVLAEIKDTQFSPEVSTSKSVISLVYRLDGINLNLMQFDLEGNLKFKALAKYTYFVRTAKVLNAPNGGAYLVSSECDRDHCDDERNMYSVKKFEANGKELGSLQLKFPLPGIIQDLSFYEDKGSFCLSRTQLSLGVSGLWEFKKMDTFISCFDEKDFS